MRKDDGLLDGASGTGREIDRRTIAKGVAWTVPVVIVATAAPAAAASGDVHIRAIFSQSVRTFTFTFDSHLSGASQVRITGTSDSANNWLGNTNTAGPTSISAQGTASLALTRKNNVAGARVSVYFQYQLASGSWVNGSGVFDLPAT